MDVAIISALKAYSDHVSDLVPEHTSSTYERTEVTLRKTSRSMSTAPAVPNRYVTAAAPARPAPMSSEVRTGKSGRVPRARAPSPRTVPHAKGIENQAKPPRKYALAVVAGLDAIALDQ